MDANSVAAIGTNQHFPIQKPKVGYRTHIPPCDGSAARAPHRRTTSGTPAPRLHQGPPLHDPRLRLPAHLHHSAWLRIATTASSATHSAYHSDVFTTPAIPDRPTTGTTTVSTTSATRAAISPSNRTKHSVARTPLQPPQRRPRPHRPDRTSRPQAPPR